MIVMVQRFDHTSLHQVHMKTCMVETLYVPLQSLFATWMLKTIDDYIPSYYTCNLIFLYRMVPLDDRAHQQFTWKFKATFRPSRASSGMQSVCLTKPVMGKTLLWIIKWIVNCARSSKGTILYYQLSMPNNLHNLFFCASFPVTLSSLPPPALLGINNTYMYTLYAAACHCYLQSSVHVVTGSGASLSFTLTS